MSLLLDPLSTQVPIVDEKGCPTPQFARLLQQLSLSAELQENADGSIGLADNGVTNAMLADMTTQTIKARKSALTGDPEDCTLTEVIDFVGGAAQGDILYRSATAWDNLAAGTSGQFLKTQGSGANPIWANAGISAGTSFPGSPSDNDLFYRTDRDVLYFYDNAGTRWLSVCEYFAHSGLIGDNVASTTTTMPNPWNGTYETYLEELVLTSQMVATGTWSIQAFRFNGATFNSLASAFSTAGDAANTQITRKSTLNIVLSNAEEGFQVNWTRTGGTLRGGISLRYRLVG